MRDMCKKKSILILGGCAYERLFSFKLEVEVLGVGDRGAWEGSGSDGEREVEFRASGTSDFRFLLKLAFRRYFLRVIGTRNG